MALKKIELWEEAMHAFIEDRAAAPFTWGKNDCALFVCDHIEKITGTDVGEAFRGTYHDKLGALLSIKRITNGSSVEDAAVFITKKFEMPELSTVKLAQRGDVVVFDGSEDGPAMGIVHLNGVHALFVSDTGLRRTKVSLCRRAWRVG